MMTERTSVWVKWLLEFAVLLVAVGVFVATTRSDVSRLYGSVAILARTDTILGARIDSLTTVRLDDSQIIHALGKIRCLETSRATTQMAGLPCDRLLRDAAQ